MSLMFSCHGASQQNTFIDFISGFVNPFFMAITSNNSYGYVCDLGSNTVFVVDTNPSSPTFNTFISAPALVAVFTHPTCVAIAPNDKIAYVTDQNSQSVILIDTDPSSPTFNTIIPAPNLINAFSDPFGIAIIPNGLYAYVINKAGGSSPNSVNVINLSNNTILNTPALNNILNDAFAIKISHDGNYGYITNTTGQNIVVIDTNPSSLTFNTVLSAPGLSPVTPQPEGISFTPNGDFAYVANSPDVTWIDTNPLSPTFNTVLSAPGLVNAFNAANDTAVIRNGKYTYVSNFLGQSGNISCVSVIDTNPASPTFNTVLLTPGLNSPAPVPRFVTLSAAPNGAFVYAVDVNSGNIGVIYTGAAVSPSDFAGCKIINKFLFEWNYINRLTWSAPAVGSTPANYKIYRDRALTQLVSTVPGDGLLRYDDHRGSPFDDTYYIVSVYNDGSQSDPASTTVNTYCS